MTAKNELIARRIANLVAFVVCILLVGYGMSAIIIIYPPYFFCALETPSTSCLRNLNTSTLMILMPFLVAMAINYGALWNEDRIEMLKKIVESEETRDVLSE